MHSSWLSHLSITVFSESTRWSGEMMLSTFSSHTRPSHVIHDEGGEKGSDDDNWDVLINLVSIVKWRIKKPANHFKPQNEFNEAQKRSQRSTKRRRKLSSYRHRTIQLILLFCDSFFLMGKINFHSHTARLSATKFAHPRSVPS